MGARSVCSTVRTTRSLLDESLRVRGRGESIRFWEERSQWRESPYPLWRVYAETLRGSDATRTLSRSSNYRAISRGDLEEAVGLPTARKLWMLWGADGNATAPSLVIMAGAPLVGKTTLAREIARRAQEPAIVVENDAVRAEVASESGDNVPRYTLAEHRRTHNVSWELIRLGLSNECHVVFDATNRTERGREGAYAAAAEFTASVLVVFVSAKPETLAARHEAATAERRRAYEKLGSQSYDAARCSVPSVAANSEGAIDAVISHLLPRLPIPLR